MALVLDATTKTLEIDLDGAVSTTQLPFTVHYADYTSTSTVPGSGDGATNDTTAVTLLAAPAASTQRLVSAISIYNIDTAAAVVSVQLNNNATLRTMIKATLAVGDSLQFENGRWWATDSTGRIKQGSGAPDDATYITQTASGSLTNEQALGGLSSGIMRVATTTGVVTALTTSAGIAANISDETGTDKLVFNTSPTFVTALVAGSTTMALLNTTATTINAFGAATPVIVTTTGVGIGVTPSAQLNLYRNNTEDGDPQLRLENEGTGDASMEFVATGALGWTMGLDNSDSDKLKIGTHSNLSSQNKLTINTAGSVFINATANANMTQGLTIQQGANDDEILALKSTDVGHGVTTITETDTYFTLQKVAGSVGGARARAYSNVGTAYSYILAGIAGASNTTKSTGSLAPVMIDSYVSNGTGVQSVGANGNILCVRDNALVRLVVDAEGTIHQIPGSDKDIDLLTVQVTGTPTLSWDESETAHSFSDGLSILGGFGMGSATIQAQQAHIVDADGSLADITTKFNTLLADLEGFGFLATS